MPIVEVKKPKTILEGKKSKMVQEVAKQKTRVEDLAKALHNYPLDIGNRDPKDVAERILAGTVKKIYLEYDLQQDARASSSTLRTFRVAIRTPRQFSL